MVVPEVRQHQLGASRRLQHAHLPRETPRRAFPPPRARRPPRATPPRRLRKTCGRGKLRICTTSQSVLSGLNVYIKQPRRSEVTVLNLFSIGQNEFSESTISPRKNDGVIQRHTNFGSS